jgi:two-component system nitrogen regulation sensor histidine kinase NtrY
MSEPLPAPPRRRIGLGVKLTLLLLVIAMTPLLVSVILVDKISELAANFGSNQAAVLRPPLESAQRAYRELIDSKKAQYAALTARWAFDPDAVALVAPESVLDGAAFAERVMAASPELASLTLRRADGSIVVEQVRTTSAPAAAAASRRKDFTEAIPGGGELVLGFTVRADLQDEYGKVDEALKIARRFDTYSGALPPGYRKAFFYLVGGVVLAVTLIGIFLSQRISSRVAVLVSGTRRVASGDLKTRVKLAGRDEMAELAYAFNRMLEDLEHERSQIAYLQRIGAWQDVARQLAHEIKNPLTPIQLAVQQAVSSYKGDDARYRKALADTEEIVTEEITNLKRLVDTFRTLGQLPRVEPKPLVLASVVDDLIKEPQLAQRLRVEPGPDGDVMIRGDRLLLRRVLTNLVENGIHAGVEAGNAGDVVVSWRLQPGRGKVVVAVDDAGKGVAADVRERIFEPYVTTKSFGTGLGLAISRKIAIEHGGELEIAAERAPTGGARFLLTLPVADGKAPATSA